MNDYNNYCQVRITAKFLVPEDSASVYAGQWVYSWQEQFFDATTGRLTDNPAGRFGTYDPATDVACAPLFERNNRTLAVNSYQFIRQQGSVANQTTYMCVVESQLDIIKLEAPADGTGLYRGTIQGWLNDDWVGELVPDCNYFDANNAVLDPTVTAPIWVLGMLVQAADPADPLSLPLYSGAGGSGVTGWKQYVRCATTTAITLATGLSVGSVIDNVTLVEKDRVLVKDQLVKAENGIYVVPASGPPKRAKDCASPAQLVCAITAVSEGQKNANSIWEQMTPAPITINVTDLVWGLISPNSWKYWVRCATVESGNFSTAYSNGQTVDGVTLITGDRVLLKDMSSAAYNLLVTVNPTGPPTPVTDADIGQELVGAVVYVAEGVKNKETIWAQVQPANLIIIGSALKWKKVWPIPRPFPARLTSGWTPGYSWVARMISGTGFVNAEVPHELRTPS